MSELVSKGLPPRYPKPAAATSIMDRRHSGIRLDAGTSESISTSGGALEQFQGTTGISNSIIEDGDVRPSSDDLTSFPSTENGVASSSGHLIKNELENLYRYKWNGHFDPNMDPRKMRRVLGNRVCAQRTRLKKLEYISQLEQSATGLEAAVSLMVSQISQYNCIINDLTIENNAIRMRIDRQSGKDKFKEAEMEWLKAEKIRLLGIFMEQQQQKLYQTYHPQLQLEMQQQLQLPEQQHEQLFNMNSPTDLRPFPMNFELEDQMQDQLLLPMENHQQQPYMNDPLNPHPTSMNDQLELQLQQLLQSPMQIHRPQQEQLFNNSQPMNLDPNSINYPMW